MIVRHHLCAMKIVFLDAAAFLDSLLENGDGHYRKDMPITMQCHHIRMDIINANVNCPSQCNKFRLGWTIFNHI